MIQPVPLEDRHPLKDVAGNPLLLDVYGIPIISLIELRRVMREHPALSGDGLGKEDAEPSISLTCVCEALRWIAVNCRPTRALRHNHSSYGWKHVMEQESGAYVSNGEFILAALLLGYRPSAEPGELNPWFNMARREDDDA